MSTPSPSIAPMPTEVLAQRCRTLEQTLATVVVGQAEACRLAMVSVLTCSHALIQGVPGIAKTLLVRSLAGAFGVRFGRIQFTADLMPSDILGIPVYHPGSGELKFRPGPIFTDLLLGDEINRAPAKTQAAMLEAMQERRVTIDGTSHALGDIFTVFATQNPVEQEGTYALPEAELDRFLFRIDMDYPSAEHERAMLESHHVAEPPIESVPVVFSAEDLASARATVAQVRVQGELFDYVLGLVRATRDDSNLMVGGSPRAGLWLVRAAKALAALHGRDYVVPEDVQEVWLPTFRHRVVLDPGAEVSGMGHDEALLQVLRRVAVPH